MAWGDFSLKTPNVGKGGMGGVGGGGGGGGGAPPLRTSTKKEERGSKKGPFCANVLTK